jgi:hypothetical protein
MMHFDGIEYENDLLSTHNNSHLGLMYDIWWLQNTWYLVCDTCWPHILLLTIYASNQRHLFLHVQIVHASGNGTQSSISYIPVRTSTKYSFGLVESIESKVFNLASNGHDICEEHSSTPGGWEKKNSGLIQGYTVSIRKPYRKPHNADSLFVLFVLFATMRSRKPQWRLLCTWYPIP